MIYFRNAWVNALIDNKFGGASSNGLVQAWPASLEAPTRTTVWRWISGKAAIPSDQILPLAGVLDVDPIALFECSATDYAKVCLGLMQDVATPDPSPVSESLEWAYSLITPSYQWPPKFVATKFYDRLWKTVDFSHRANERRNYFQRVVLSAKLRPNAEPQVWHFAFKTSGALNSVWRPFGIVLRESEMLRLYHCRGLLAEANVACGEESISIETWFGDGPADFRIASLHPFQAHVLQHWDRAVSCLRFS